MDLNVMMREQAQMGLQRELDAAVTDGDIAKVTEITKKMTAMAVALAPKAAAYGDAEIKTELEKLDWFGVDPKKTGRAMVLGKDMNIKKFADAAAFAAALVKAVDAEFPAPAAAAGEGEDDDGAGGNDDGDTEDPPARKPAAQRKTDGPNEGDNNQRSNLRRQAGPWTKLSDAPAAIQKEINRTADKFAPKTKDGREKYITLALAPHYAEHVRKAGKK